MDSPAQRIPVDVGALEELERQFFEYILADFPEFLPHASMAWDPETRLWVPEFLIPSPSGDAACSLHIWLYGRNDPSLTFQGWHIHRRSLGFHHFPPPDTEEFRHQLSEEFLDLIQGILDDDFVFFSNGYLSPSGSIEYFGGLDCLDLRYRDALLEKMTDPDTSPEIRIISWSGKHNGIVRLADLRL